MSLTKRNPIAEVKVMLKNVVSNLKALENNQANQMICENQCLLKKNTLELLKKLESLPLESINKKIVKRQQTRKQKKLKKNAISLKITTTNFDYGPNTTIQTDTTLQTQKPSTKTLMYYRKALREGQRFLKIFNLIERLHLLRSKNCRHTRKFSKKLEKLQFIWEDICLEKTSCINTTIEQWRQVLFGASERREKVTVQQLIKRRTIWDSYLNLKHGTPIPLGWILPPTSPNNEWSKYLSY